MASAVWGPGGIPAPLQPAPSRVLPPFLRLLLVPWTLQLAGKSVSFSRPLGRIHQRDFHPAGAANSRDSSLGICWLRLNIVDFTWEAFGD